MDFPECSRQKPPSLPSADSLVNTFTKCLVHKDCSTVRGWVKRGAATSVRERKFGHLSVKADWTAIDILETVTRGTKMANHNDAPHTLEIWQLFATQPLSSSNTSERKKICPFCFLQSKTAMQRKVLTATARGTFFWEVISKL